jgi:hypothetical protein
MKHIIYKESTHFQEFIFIQKKKKNHLPKQLYEFFITIFKKQIQKFIGMQKDVPFSKVMLLARFISFVPNIVFTWYIGIKKLSQSCSFHYNEKMDLKK